VVAVTLPVALGILIAACGTTDKASTEPLPPIRTTTSSTTIPGTTIPEGVRQFWVIERGDTLASIASATGVTVQSIIDLNNIENPDSIQAGQTIEIPAGIVVLNSPGANTSTTTIAT
jgi:LysM repeat protein